MNSKWIVFIVYLLLPTAVLAQSAINVSECKELLARAEKTGDLSVYDSCGFNDEKTAWNEWAGFVSQKQYKQALYQLCIKWPQHPYSQMYCEKSASLGYAPAMIEQGHRLMENGMGQAAVSHYTKALKTGMLTAEQEGQIAEQLALYYLEEGSEEYSPAKAVAFLQTAATRRSALANHMMGHLSYTGQYGVAQDDKQAFEYFWRAILLGCPAAEENLGLFHLVRLGKINRKTGAFHMQPTFATCQAGVNKPKRLDKPAGCDCDEVLSALPRYLSKAYYLMEVNGQTALLKNAKNEPIVVSVGQNLTDGYHVLEIRTSAVILLKDGERVVLNILPDSDCIDYCQVAEEYEGIEDTEIKPYRLSFSPQECQDLMYYAPLLVDVTQPFVGKTECAGSLMMEQDPVLQLINAKQDVPNVDMPASMPSEKRPIVQNKQRQAVKEMSRTSDENAVVKPRPDVLPKKARKEIHFTVGGGAFSRE